MMLNFSLDQLKASQGFQQLTPAQRRSTLGQLRSWDFDGMRSAARFLASAGVVKVDWTQCPCGLCDPELALSLVK